MSKYWITPEGSYIRGYGADIAPQDATEVPVGPDDDTDIWDGVKWNADPAVVIAESNATIIAEMDAADLKIIRAIAEGDIERLEAHKTSQALLRAKLL